MGIRNYFICILGKNLDKRELSPDKKKHIIETICNNNKDILDDEEDDWDVTPFTGTIEFADDWIIQKQIELGIEIDGIQCDYFDNEGNPKLQFGRSLLHQAISDQDLDSIKEILNNGANIQEVDNGGKTFWQRALATENDELIMLIKEYKDQNIISNNT